MSNAACQHHVPLTASDVACCQGCEPVSRELDLKDTGMHACLHRCTSLRTLLSDPGCNTAAEHGLKAAPSQQMPGKQGLYLALRPAIAVNGLSKMPC